MFTKIRNRVEEERGFTLIELLVVILIIGILAAIAIPSFLNQREKGQDACAKSMSRTMQTAMETYFTDNNSYVGATIGTLNTIENQIVTAAPCGGISAASVGLTGAAGTCVGAPAADAYAVCTLSVATGGGAHSFSVARAAGGAITRACTPAGQGGCPTGAAW